MDSGDVNRTVLRAVLLLVIVSLGLTIVLGVLGGLVSS
jgi:hypothetical protein